MGDRTTVTITVLNEHVDALLALAEQAGDEGNLEYKNDVCTAYYFHECNYAEVGFEQTLVEQGIAYDKEWDPGGEYPRGFEYARFTPEGFPIVITFDIENKNPDLAHLLEIINRDDDKIRQRVELVKYIELFSQAVTPLPWDNQAAYGNIYRTRLLVGAPTTEEQAA